MRCTDYTLVLKGGETYQSTASGFIVIKKEQSIGSLKSNRNENFDYSGRAIDGAFPIARNISENHRISTGSTKPSELQDNYRLTTLTASFDWCAVKVS